MFCLIAVHCVFRRAAAPRRAHQEFLKGWPRIAAGQRPSSLKELFAKAKSSFLSKEDVVLWIKAIKRNDLFVFEFFTRKSLMHDKLMHAGLAENANHFPWKKWGGRLFHILSLQVSP